MQTVRYTCHADLNGAITLPRLFRLATWRTSNTSGNSDWSWAPDIPCF
ncbi:hypothetical protein ACFO25_14000 [Paenactinomyces guangxiensis]|uniref:Uncharacterized protein n=1 Tax=Paenactinomyces guangxiensis TaxID=1490290 RepID=A0A7W1WP86_9BACL|nr:hypothetical protein [Paenactinomyces guangxiensis]MBA4493553.1 hypothetical protein [Paenactinomyces guangxiensis]MBH8590644.1 hypothetical protein [Paenactinomyces guangxiensis]